MERPQNILSELQAAVFYGGLALASLGATSEVATEIKIQSLLVSKFPDLVAPADYHRSVLRQQHYKSTFSLLEQTNHSTDVAEIRSSPDFQESVTIIQNYDLQQRERLKIAQKTRVLMSEGGANLSMIIGLSVSYVLAVLPAADWILESYQNFKSLLGKSR